MMDLQTNKIVDIQLVQVFENIERPLVMYYYLKNASILLIECHVGS